MKHFERVLDDVDRQPILAELAAHPEAWGAQVGRQDRAAPQRETASIPIRGGRRSKVRGRRNRDVLETRRTTVSKLFPSVHGFMEGVAARFDADVARARIVRLAPQSRVYPHTDRGDYYQHHDRYHLVLESPSGSPMRAGDETVRMREGELWWFDNKALHDASNPTDTPRIHLIFDLRPRSAAVRRSPPTPPPRLEEETRALAELLGEARSDDLQDDGRVVQQAVRLYLVGRRDPDAWVELLRAHGHEPDDEGFQPLRATLSMVDPEMARPMRQHRARSTVWAIEQIELGKLRWADVPGAIVEAGGVEAVAGAWKQAQAAQETDH